MTTKERESWQLRFNGDIGSRDRIFLESKPEISLALRSSAISAPPSNVHTTGESYYMGIDVGTDSLRATLVSKSGKVVASSTQETKTWRDPLDHSVFEQSTTDIRVGVGKVIKECAYHWAEEAGSSRNQK